MGQALFVIVISTLPVIVPDPSARPTHETVNPAGPQVPSMAPVLSPSGGGGGTTPPSPRPATTQPSRRPATNVPKPHGF